ncbi:MAG: uracil-DNA glycosylase [Patescibacteria group bacterium]
MEVKIQEEWQKALSDEFKKEYFKNLVTKVKHEYQTTIVYPKPSNIFRAFDLVPLSNIKVVILGQDPYHTEGVADGLSFSTLPGNKTPPSLQNIYKEIITEFSITDYPYLSNPDLTRWAEQGVLLINSTLTVRKGEANSHSGIGWNVFTDQVIKIISDQLESVVFLLWGNFAKSKINLIDQSKHLVLQSAHPSPFSAYNGFFGNNHFKLTNEHLLSKKNTPIKW